MAAPVPDVACYVFIGVKTFSTSQSNLAFIRDKCCHLSMCSRLMEPNYFLFPVHQDVSHFFLTFFFAQLCLFKRIFCAGEIRLSQMVANEPFSVLNERVQIREQHWDKVLSIKIPIVTHECCYNLEHVFIFK